jgi:hypothetical protein
MPCGPGPMARSVGQANLPKRMIDIAGYLSLAFKIGQRADLPIGSRTARCGRARARRTCPLLPCRLREFAAFGIVADIAADGEVPVFAPQCLEQTRGGTGTACRAAHGRDVF